MNEKVNVDLTVDEILFLQTCVGYWSHLDYRPEPRAKNVLMTLSEALVNFKASKMLEEVDND